MGIVPRFDTTSAAVYGRFVFAKRALYKGGGHETWRVGEKINQRTFHQRSTSATSARNAVLSLDMVLARKLALWGCFLDSK